MELNNSYTCSDFVQKENEHFQTSEINCPANNENYVVVETNEKDLSQELPVHLQDYSNYDKSNFCEAFIEKSLYTRAMEKAANKYSDLKEHCKMLKQQMKLKEGEQIKQIELFTKKMRKNEDIHLKKISDLNNQLTEIKMECDVKNKEIIQYKDQLSIKIQKCDFFENKYNAKKEKSRNLKKELNELKEKLNNNNKELIQTQELYNREKQTCNLLEPKYNKANEKARNLIEYVKQMDILKDEICAEFNKHEAEYVHKIRQSDIENMELKLKLDQNLLKKSKAKQKQNLENFKQNLLLEKYNYLSEVNERLNLQIHQMESKHAKQLEVLKTRFQIEMTIKEAVHNDYTGLMGIKVMEFEDKLETKFCHAKQKLKNLLKSEKQKKSCLEEKYNFLKQTNRNILQKFNEMKTENEKLITFLKRICDSEINKKVNNDETISQIRNRLKNIKEKLEIYQAKSVTQR